MKLRNRGRLRMALAGTVAMCSLLTAGCESPDDSGPDEVTDLTGTITGTVLDSNGSPVAGAVIRYAGENTAGMDDITAATNAAGQFRMPGVVVSGVTTIGENDANGPITLVVESPSGNVRYLGATVQVTPEAQTTSSPGGDTTFFDEFNVDTGEIRLPALTTTVQGTLRSATTGAGLAGSSLTLDFQGVDFDQDGAAGIATTYNSGANLVVTTDTSGNFRFSGVPGDSCLALTVSGATIGSISGQAPACTLPGSDATAWYLATRTEGSTMSLGSIVVTPFANGDTVAPVVSAVEGVIDPGSDPGTLASTATEAEPHALVVRFSEPVQNLFSTGLVSVVVGAEGSQTLATIEAATLSNNNALTIDLASELPAGTPVSVLIAREAIQDLAGNPVALNEAIAYDEFSGSSSQYLKLDLVRASTTVDTVPPQVADVLNVVNDGASVGQLEPSVTGTAASPLSIRFTDPLQAGITTADVVVLVGSAQTPVSVTAVEQLDGGSQLNIILANPLPSNQPVELRLQREAFLDLSNNPLTTGPTVGFDYFAGNDNQFVSLLLQTGVPATSDTTPPVLASTVGVLESDVTPAVLESSVRSTLTLVFNEPMQTGLLRPEHVQVLVNNGAVALSSIAFTDSRTLVLQLATPLAPAQSVRVTIAREALKDMAGLPVENNPAIAYDTLAGTGGQNLQLSYTTAQLPGG